MISETMAKDLNTQINRELFSSYYYLSMAAWAAANNLDGTAHFFQKQAQEEVGHAMKLYGYVNEQGQRVALEAIEKPKADFADIEDLFTLALEHEKLVTKNIYKLVDLAIKEGDHATRSFLSWYVAEQVEEEASMDGFLHKIKLAGKAGHAILMIDAQLARRE